MAENDVRIDIAVDTKLTPDSQTKIDQFIKQNNNKKIHLNVDFGGADLKALTKAMTRMQKDISKAMTLDAGAFKVKGLGELSKQIKQGLQSALKTMDALDRTPGVVTAKEQKAYGDAIRSMQKYQRQLAVPGVKDAKQINSAVRAMETLTNATAAYNQQLGRTATLQKQAKQAAKQANKSKDKVLSSRQYSKEVAKIEKVLLNANKIVGNRERAGVGVDADLSRAIETMRSEFASFQKAGTATQSQLTQLEGVYDTLTVAMARSTKGTRDFTTAQKDANTQLRKQQEAADTLLRQQQSADVNLQWIAKMEKQWTGMSKASKSMLAGFKEQFGSQAIRSDVAQLKALNDEFSRFRSTLTKTGQNTGGFFTNFKRKLGTLGAWITPGQFANQTMNQLRDMLRYTRELNTAMVGLQKVSSGSNATYDAYLSSALQRSRKLGVNPMDYVGATTGFSRIGESLPDAQRLGEIATIYKNVGDEVGTIEDATNSLISTTKAFKLESADAMEVVDKFNYVGNRFAITSGGIGEVLKRSAASMATANTSLEKTIALATAGNTVVQNAEKMGSALTTMAMRIRGAESELMEAGLETDEYTASTSKLREEVLALTKVDIMQDANTFKDVYQILDEISQVWDSLSDISRANVMEILFGKMRGNVGASILNNFDIARDVLEQLTDGSSTGSAMKEYNTFLDSVEAKEQKLMGSTVALSQSLFSPDVMKGALDIANTFVGVLANIAEVLGSFPTLASAAALGLNHLFGKETGSFFGLYEVQQGQGLFGSSFGTSTQAQKERLDALAPLEEKLQNLLATGATDIDDNIYSKLGKSAQDFLTKNGRTVEGLKAFVEQQRAAIPVTHTLGSVLASVSKDMKELGVAAGKFAIVWAVMKGAELLFQAIDRSVNRTKYAIEAAEEASAKWDEVQTAQRKARQTLDSGDEFMKLREGVDQATGANISLNEDELTRYHELVNSLGDVFPQLVSGWDAQGNAILGNISNVEELTTAYRNLAQEQRRSFLYDKSGGAADMLKGAYAQLAGKDEDNEVTLRYGAQLAREAAEFFRTGSTPERLMMTGYNGEPGMLYETVFRGALQGLDRTSEDYAAQAAAALEKHALLLEGQVQSVVASGYYSIIDAAFNYAADGLADPLADGLRSVLGSALKDLSAETLLDFGDGEDGLQNLIEWVTEVTQAFGAGEGKDVLNAAVNAQQKFQQGELSYAELKNQRQNLVNNIPLEGEMYNTLAPLLRDQIFGEMSMYQAAVERGKQLVGAELGDNAEDVLGALNAKYLRFVLTLDPDVPRTVAELDRMYADSMKMEDAAQVTKDWTKAQEAQKKATEALKAQDANGGRLDKASYDALPAAYKRGLSTFNGEYVLDPAKTQAAMTSEVDQLLAKSEQTLLGLMGTYEDTQKRINALEQSKEETAEAQLQSEREKLAQLRDQIVEQQLLQQEMRNANSALTRWQQAQEGGETGDTFRSLRDALTQLTQGMKSGRTNTNKYQTSGDLLFGRDSGWQRWSDKERQKQLDRASKLYTKDGQLDNAEFYRQAYKAGIVDKKGDFTSKWSVQDMARQMGYSAEFMAQVIRAGQEYGDNKLNFTAEDLEKWIPKTETEANTSALSENTAALTSLAGALAAYEQGKNEGTGGGTETNGELAVSGDGAAQVEALRQEASQPVDMPVNADTAPAERAGTAVRSAIGAPISIPVFTYMAGVPGAGGIPYGMSKTMKGFADGTSDAPEGNALVAEEGAEMIVSRKHGSWRLASYPQLTHLDRGDIVFTAQQTAAILQGKRPTGGRAYALGTIRSHPWLNQTALGVGGNLVFTSPASVPKYTSPDENHISPGNGGKGGGRGGRGGGSKAPSTQDILDKLSRLYDWVERALEVAQKATQKLIDAVADKIGSIAQNKALDDAIRATANELTKNQQGYKKYMETAARVRRETGLSQSIVNKIQKGNIEIADYDEATQKKIKEYQTWYNKAEQCLDTIEELKKQQKELALQKLDNILDYYDRLAQRSETVAEYTSAMRDYMAATGKEIKASDYTKEINATSDKIAKMRQEREVYQQQLNQLVASGVLKVDSNEWHDRIAELEKLDQTILETSTSLEQLKTEMEQIAVTNLQYALDRLVAAQNALQGMMNFHDAQGSKHQATDYEQLINNGAEQIKNLTAQNAELREQQKGLDVLSSRWQELQQQIEGNEQSIWDIMSSQEQWNDMIADLEIAKLQEEREELEKQNEELQKKLDMEQALEDLAKARQRKRLIFRENVGFVYEADQKAIQDAQKRVDELQHQETLDKIDEAIDAIEKNKADDNVYNYEGTEQIKQFPQGRAIAVADTGALYGMVRSSASANQLVSTSLASALGGALGSSSGARNVSISFGDIRVMGVQDASAFAQSLVTDLRPAMLQALGQQ